MSSKLRFCPLSALVSKVANLFKKDVPPISQMLESGLTSQGEAEIFYSKKVIMFLENRGGCDYGHWYLGVVILLFLSRCKFFDVNEHIVNNNPENQIF